MDRRVGKEAVSETFGRRPPFANSKIHRIDRCWMHRRFGARDLAVISRQRRFSLARALLTATDFNGSELSATDDLTFPR